MGTRTGREGEEKETAKEKTTFTTHPFGLSLSKPCPSFLKQVNKKKGRPSTSSGRTVRGGSGSGKSEAS